MTSIGKVDFEVDARTEGLRKAVAQMQRFEQQVNRVARSQTSAAQKSAAQLARQETAIKRAYQQTLNLQQQLRKQGASNQAITNTTKAFQVLTREMSSGELNIVKYNRSLDAFNAKMQRVRRSIKETREAGGDKKKFDFTTFVRDLESASVLAVGPLSGLGARIRALGSIIGRSTLLLAAFLGGLTAVTVGLVQLTSSAIDAGRVFEQANATFLAASDSQEQADQRFAFVIQTAQRLGLRIQDLTRAYARLTAASAGTALEGQQTQQIFKGIAEAAAALRLQQTEVEGVFRAVEQIMSKGSVQAEELRGQLGERLPGAFQRAARAMGVTTQELGRMLQRGELAASDFLPRFIAELERAFGKRAEANVHSWTGSMNRLSNSWLLFGERLNAALSIENTAIGLMQKLADVIDSMGANLDILVGSVGALIGGLAALAVPTLIPFIVQGLVALGSAFLTVGESIVAFNFATAVSGKLLTVLARLALMVGGAVAGFVGMKALLGDITKSLADLEVKMENLGKGEIGGALTRDFQSLETHIRNSRIEMESLRDVMQFRNTHMDPREIKAYYDAFAKVIHLNPAEITGLAKQLSQVLGRDVAPNVVDVAAAIGEMDQSIAANRKQLQEWQSDYDKTSDTLREFFQTTRDMRADIEAMSRGSTAADYYKEVTKPLTQWEKKLHDTALTQAEQNDLLLIYKQRLEEVYNAQKAFTGADRQASQAMLDAFGELIIRARTFKDVLRDLVLQLAQVIYKATIVNSLQDWLTDAVNLGLSALGVPTAAAPTTSGQLSVGNANHRAGGGPVTAGQPYIVGERRPEIFVPSQNGTIIPQVGGFGNITIPITIQGNATPDTIEQIRLMINQEFVPKILAAARTSTLQALRRPGHAGV